MAVVSLSINGRLYEVACDESQVSRIQGLAADMDAKAQSLSKQLGQQPEGRLLVMVGLMLADELLETKASLSAGSREMVAEADTRMAEIIDNLTDRVESIADRLEQA